MKLIKRIFAVCSFCTLLTVTNCFAVILDNTNVTDNKLNCYRTYLGKIENLETLEFARGETDNE